MKKISLLSTLFFTLFITGCSSNIESVKSNSPEFLPSKTSDHIKQSQEFETIMRNFENLIFENFPSELERDKKRIAYTKDMVIILDDLVDNSKRLQSLRQSKFDADEKREYHTLARALEYKAKDLRKTVLDYRTEEIAPTLDYIVGICNQCHDVLR